MKKGHRLIDLLLLAYQCCPRWALLYLGIMAAVGLTVPAFIELQKRIIDQAALYSGSPGVGMGLFLPLLLGYLVFSYLNAVGAQVAATIKIHIMHRLEERVVGQYLRHSARLAFPAFEDSETLDVLMRLSAKQNEIHSKAVTFIPSVLRYLIELGGILYFVAASGVWWAFPLAVTISLPSFYFNKRRTVLARQVWNRDSFDIRYADYLNETLLNREAAKERRFFGFHQYLSGLWQSRFQAYNENKIRTFVKSSVATGIAMCFSMSTILVIGIALLEPLTAGVITMGLYTSVLVAVSSNMNMAVSAIIREYSNLVEMEQFLVDRRHLDEVEKIDIKPMQAGTHGKLEFESIVFDDVWFAYPGTDRYILKGVSLEMKRGENHALIGVNGAGKTTITKLMLGLYAPTKGVIYLNGRDLDSYPYSEIRSLFALTQQDFARYKDSLGVNIGLYELEQLDRARLQETLARCETADILDRCRGDYGTLLTPEFSGGLTLSGGQWQKVSISRAFYSDRDFVILDEPTAALDPQAEVRFYATYRRIMAGCTCLFITHRLGSTFLFDSCFVLSDGQIAERGTHHQLVAAGGIYRDLYERQREWYDAGAGGQGVNPGSPSSPRSSSRKEA